MARLLTLVDNFSLKPELKAVWGLSILVELPSLKLLFDVGPSFDILQRNAEALSVDLSKVDMVFISHLHADHVGALNGLLAFNPDLEIYLPDPKLSLAFVRSGFKAKYMEDAGVLAEGVYTIGVLRGVVDEQALLVVVNDRSVLLTGCAHPGVKRILESAIKISPTGKVQCVVGGLHISSASEALDAWSYLKESGVSLISPCHCTGPLARSVLADLFRDGFITNGVGCEIRLNSL